MSPQVEKTNGSQPWVPEKNKTKFDGQLAHYGSLGCDPWFSKRLAPMIPGESTVTRGSLDGNGFPRELWRMCVKAVCPGVQAAGADCDGHNTAFE